MFESAVDCLDGAVGCTDIKVGEHIFASAAPSGLALESLSATGELVGCQMHYMERVHDFVRLWYLLLDCGGISGEPIHGHYLYLFPEAGVAFLKPPAEHVCGPARPHV